MIAQRGMKSLLAAGLVIGVGCKDRSQPSASGTTTVVAPPPLPPSLPPVNPGWDSTNGPALFLSTSESPRVAQVVLPNLTDSQVAGARHFDVNKLSGLAVDLFGRKGRTGSASIAVEATPNSVEGCLSWPSAQLSGATSTDWRIALEKGRASGARLDSLEGLNATDSAQLAKQIITVASSIHTRNDSVFAGIPFAVRRAYRFMLGASPVVFTDVVRKINEEANPREERVVLVLERASSGAYVAAYQSSSAGPEEELQTTEMLAVVSLLGRKTPGIFLSSEYEDGGKIVLLERTGDMQWRRTWQSAYTGC